MRGLVVAALFVGLSSTLLQSQSTDLDSIKMLLEDQTYSDTTRVDLLNQLAMIYRRDAVKVTQYLSESDSLSDMLNYKRGKAESLRIKGLYYNSNFEFPKALDYYQQSLALYKEINDEQEIGSAYYLIGLNHRHQGKYTDALTYYHEALKIFKKIEYKKGLGNTYVFMGTIYRIFGDYPKALEFYHKALKIADENNHQEIAGMCHGFIRLIYWEQRDYDLFFKHNRMELDIMLELQNKQGIAASYLGFGDFYKLDGNYSRSFFYYEKALELQIESEDKINMSATYNKIGDTYLLQNKHSRALSFFKKALEVAQATTSPGVQSESNINLAKSYFYLKKYKLAESYGIAGYEIAKEGGENELIKDAAEVLSKVYVALNDYQKAFEFTNQFQALSDSLFNEDRIKKMTQLEYQYKFEKEKQAMEIEQQQKDELKAEQDKRKETIQNAIVIGLILSLILIFVIWRNAFIKQKANKLLLVQKEEIQSQKDELEKLSIVAQKTTNAVAIFNKNGNFEWVNEGFERLYEQPLEELFMKEGINLFETIPNSYIKSSERHNPDSPEVQAILTAIKACISDKKPTRYQYYTVTKSGREVIVQTTLTPILDEQGNIKKLVGIDSDISLLKRAEKEILQQKNEIQKQANMLTEKNTLLEAQNEEIRTQAEQLKKFNDHLEELVSQRTKRIEKQSQQIREYAFSNSHLVRAPLAKILGLSELLGDESSLSPEIRSQLIVEVRAAANELDVVIREVAEIITETSIKNNA